MVARRPSPDDLTQEMMRLVERPELASGLDFWDVVHGRKRGGPYRTLARAYSLLRDAGRMSEDEARARIAYCLVKVADGGQDVIDDAFDPLFEGIYECHGLGPEEDWRDGEEPEDHRRLVAEYEALVEQHTAIVLSELGDEDLADLFENDRRAFNELIERGRRAVHG